MSRSKSLQRLLERRAATDVDPEDDGGAHQDESSRDEESNDDFGGREHYETVERSRLRQHEQPQLGTKYRDSAVSRAALEEHGLHDPLAPVDVEDDDDPFAVTYGSGNASELNAEQKRERVRKRLASDMRHIAVNESDDTNDNGDGDTDERSITNSEIAAFEDGVDFMSDEEDESNSQISASSTSSPLPTTYSAANREKMKLLNKADSSAMAVSLSAAASADIKKGLAVQVQQSAYDRLLDARIKMQKGLNASNNLSPTLIKSEEAADAMRKAEAAALSLWTTIESIRLTLTTSKESRLDKYVAKRKRDVDMDSKSKSGTQWEQSKSLEDSAMSNRRSTLNKWSASTRAAAPSAGYENQLTSVLDAHLSSEFAKADSVLAVADNEVTYTDDSFYQSLLRDLIASRTQSSASVANASVLSTKLHPSGSSRKTIDTRASKGRKIRYTVHEKLQNFMAPEDRNTWSEAARREFFGSLFGQRLLEKEGVEGVSGDGESAIREEASLRLFRNQ